MEEWKEMKLSQIVDLIHGYQFRDEDFTVTGIPVIKINNVINDGLRLTNLSYIAESRLSEFKEIVIVKGDILMSLTGNIGRVIEVQSIGYPVLQNYRVGKFEPISNLVIKSFLKHLLSQDSLFNQLSKFANQSAQANFGKQDLNKLVVQVPTSLTEQTHIANILSTADEAIAQTEQLIAKYQRIKTGLMQDLLTKGIDEHGNIRNKATHKFIVKNGVEVPEEWEVVEFEIIADKKTKWSLTGGPFGSNLKAEDYTISGIRIIQLQNIGDGEFKDSYKIFTTEKKANELLSCNIYPNEIILSKMGDPVARACFIPNSANRFLMASDGIRLLPDSKIFNRHFVLTYINYELFRNAVSKIATGSTRQRIGLRDLKKMPFVKPSIVEQNRISKLILETENSIESEQHKLQKLHSLKKGLMQDLLSGKVRVKM
jgi:type I restriction enzyme S subunit